jgi:hypothetical protein
VAGVVDVERLRAVAEAASDDPPTWYCPKWLREQTDGLIDQLDAEHIATFDPPTVLGLLDRLAAAERRLALVEALAEKFGRTGGETWWVTQDLRGRRRV